MQRTFMEWYHQKVAEFWTYLGDSQSRVLKAFRTVILAATKFKQDDCMLYAASLAFYSLIALVPVLALVMGISRGFGFDKYIESSLKANFASHQEAIDTVLGFASNLLGNGNSGIIAGVGIIILGWSVLKVLGDVEKAFNVVWGIRRARPPGRKINDYLSLVILAPIAMFIANSFTIYISNELVELAPTSPFIAEHTRSITLLFSLAPLAMICGLLAWLYYFLPNTMVDFSSASLGGIIAGILFSISQWIYISFQVGATRYDAIYGSFVALPLLFIWIYICWIIVLLGCQISFTHQTRMRQPWELSSRALSHRMKISLMLKITQLCVRFVHRGRKPMTGRDIAFRLMVPYTYIKPLLENLVQSGILFDFKPVDSNRIYFIPNNDIHKLTVQYVIDTLESSNYLKELHIKPKTFEQIEKYCDEYEDYFFDHGLNTKLVDIKNE